MIGGGNVFSGDVHKGQRPFSQRPSAAHSCGRPPNRRILNSRRPSHPKCLSHLKISPGESLRAGIAFASGHDFAVQFRSKFEPRQLDALLATDIER